MPAYSSGVISSLSFKSAPAQNAWSLSLARINALVPPWPFSLCRPSTTPPNSESRCVETALRAWGLFSEITAMLPAWGAGMLAILMADDKEVEYRTARPLSHCLAKPWGLTARARPHCMMRWLHLTASAKLELLAQDSTVIVGLPSAGKRGAARVWLKHKLHLTSDRTDRIV